MSVVCGINKEEFFTPVLITPRAVELVLTRLLTVSSITLAVPVELSTTLQTPLTGI
jgi:hypothetical protein